MHSSDVVGVMKIEKLIAVCGLPCSGKTTFGEVARSIGFAVIEGSDVVRAKFQAFHQPGEDMTGFASRWWSETSPDFFTREVIENMVAKLPTAVYVGCRNPHEIRYLRDTVKEVRTLGLFSDTLERFQRSMQRGRQDNPFTLTDFIHRDMRELEMGLASLMAHCIDRLVINNDSLDVYLGGARTEIINYFGVSS